MRAEQIKRKRRLLALLQNIESHSHKAIQFLIKEEHEALHMACESVYGDAIMLIKASLEFQLALDEKKNEP